MAIVSQGANLCPRMPGCSINYQLPVKGCKLNTFKGCSFPRLQMRGAAAERLQMRGGGVRVCGVEGRKGAPAAAADAATAAAAWKAAENAAADAAAAAASKAAVAWMRKMKAAAKEASSPRLGIFWDIESCGLPRGVPPEVVVDNIKRYLRTRGINQPINAFVAGIDDKHIFLPESVLEVLSSCGVEFLRGDVCDLILPLVFSTVLVISKRRSITYRLFRIQRYHQTSVLIARLVYGQLKEWLELATFPGGGVS